MDNIDGGNQLVMDGRVLRDQLTLTGEHPEILAKLNHLVDKAYLNPAEAEKLKQLLALVNSK
ncbi:hypothetical protein EI534_25910 [Pseudomonas frederiksbergensis]|nr:hypothetical protein [Pseudomonas frederiksbergensis]